MRLLSLETCFSIFSWIVGPDVKLEDCLSAFFTNDELKGIFSYCLFVLVKALKYEKKEWKIDLSRDPSINSAFSSSERAIPSGDCFISILKNFFFLNKKRVPNVI